MCEDVCPMYTSDVYIEIFWSESLGHTSGGLKIIVQIVFFPIRFLARHLTEMRIIAHKSAVKALDADIRHMQADQEGASLLENNAKAPTKQQAPSYKGAWTKSQAP